MHSTKILIGLAVLAIFCVTYSHSIQCYTCNDEKSCKNPAKSECTQFLAEQTRLYLYSYHKNSPNTTSPYFECFREYFKNSNTKLYHKGCIYSHINACGLEMKEHLLQGKTTRECKKCNNKNYCNPAGRSELNVSLPLVTIILAVLGKYYWN